MFSALISTAGPVHAKSELGLLGIRNSLPLSPEPQASMASRRPPTGRLQRGSSRIKSGGGSSSSRSRCSLSTRCCAAAGVARRAAAAGGADAAAAAGADSAYAGEAAAGATAAAAATAAATAAQLQQKRPQQNLTSSGVSVGLLFAVFTALNSLQLSNPKRSQNRTEQNKRSLNKVSSENPQVRL